jgi:superfamily II DNA helicase RecQ
MALGSDYAFNSALKERVASGAAYFVKVLEVMSNSLDEIPTDISNKQTKKRILDVRQHLRDNINVKIATLNQVIDNGFAPSTYLATKGDATLGTDKTKRKEDKKPSNKPKAVDDIVIENQDAYVALVEWRAAEARRISVPAYTLATNKALAGIANMMPTTVEELHEVAYLSKNTINRYGDTIIDIITTINK